MATEKTRRYPIKNQSHSLDHEDQQDNAELGMSLYMKSAASRVLICKQRDIDHTSEHFFDN